MDQNDKSKQFNSNIDLTAIWKKMADEKFSNAQIEKQNIMDAIKLKSNDDINLLKKRLKHKLNYGIAFIVLFIVLMIWNSDKIEFVKLMSFATVVYLILAILLYIKYKKMGVTTSGNNDILTTMKTNLATIKSALNFERLWGLCIVPLAIPVGLLIGETLRGETISQSIRDPKFAMVALGLTIVILPLMFIATEKMNKSAYGHLIKGLEENIIKMETLS